MIQEPTPVHISLVTAIGAFFVSALSLVLGFLLILHGTTGEVGQALYELKYNGHDWSQVVPLAHALIEHAYARFNDVGFIVPMPASRARNRQPVEEIAKAVGEIVRVPVHADFLVKCSGGPSLKDLSTKDEKVQALLGRLSVSPHHNTVKAKNVLLIDDLYDSGASMEAATNVLRECAWIDRIYVVALTWR